MNMVELSSRSSSSADYFDAKFKEISDERTELQNRLRDHEQQQIIAQNNSTRNCGTWICNLILEFTVRLTSNEVA